MFAGCDAAGRKVQISRTLRGTKRDAQRLAAQLTLRPTPLAGRRTVEELIDAYVTHRSPTWSIQTRYSHASRVRIVKADEIAGLAVARLSVKAMFVSVEEASKRIGIGRTLAYDLCHLYQAGEPGGLACVRLGRRLLVPVWAIEQLGRPRADP